MAANGNGRRASRGREACFAGTTLSTVAMMAIENVTAGQVMSKALVTAAPDDLLSEAEAVLIEHRIGGLPVVERGKLMGIVSRSDIVRVKVLMRSLDGLVTDRLRGDDQVDGFQHPDLPEFQGCRELLVSLKVRDAMHDEVATCAPSTPLADVARTMIRLHVHRVVVVEGEKPVGIVSSLDVVRFLVPAI
jgi:CBS domain-containing protein